MNRTVFGVDTVMLAGVAALAGAVAVAAVPGVVPAGLAEGLSSTVRGLVFVLAGATGLLGLWAVYRGSDGTASGSVELPATPAERERRREGQVRIVGRSIDDLLERIATPDGQATTVDRLIDQGRVQDAVRETAVDVLVDTRGYSRREARDSVDAGAWTDRPRAAAFLGGDATNLPLEVRIRDWLSGEPFERQVRAAVDELADMAGVETGSGMAPEPVDLKTTETGRPGGSGVPTADARETDLAAEEGSGPGDGTSDGDDDARSPEDVVAPGGRVVPPDAGTDGDPTARESADGGDREGTDAPEVERSAAREGSR
ncbi:hypothetical protein BRD00_00070 [Halobacteriales archaeon QS_8_69_26]|nr:MAG: hypothetical protein BRD00_00070 [Halobacteriales archaeon QS_8_69_26]